MSLLESDIGSDARRVSRPDLMLITSPGAVKLRWTRVDHATGYDVFRGTSLAGPFQVVASVGSDVHEWVDDTRQPGDRPCYRVGVRDGGVDRASVAQQIVVFPITPPVPINPTDTASGSTHPDTTSPGTDQPNDPVTDSPSDPETDSPGIPVTDPTHEPVTELPIEPVTDLPIEPVTNSPIELVTDPPSEPVTGWSDFEDVTHHGAVGNGVDPDDRAFTRATEALARGGTLVIPYRPFGYRLKSITWREDVRYVGSEGRPRSVVYLTERSVPIAPAMMKVTNVVFIRSAGVYVSGATGDDTNPGTHAAPFRRIGAAVQRAAGWWETVSIESGRYPETVTLPDNRPGPREAFPTAYVARDTGRVVIDGGERLMAGQRHASWAGVFSFPWAHDFVLNTGASTGQRFRREFGEKGHAEQFLFDDRPLKQVFGATDLLAGSDWPTGLETVAGVLGERDIFVGRFFVDWVNDTVHVRLIDDIDPATGVLEGAARQRGWFTRSGAGNIFMQGLRLRNFATFPQPNNAALRTGENWTVVDVTVEHTSNASIGIRKSGTQFVRPVVRYAGQLGMGTAREGTDRLSGCVVEGGLFEHLNYKLHDGSGQGVDGTGLEFGTKFSHTDGFILRNNTFRDCFAHAIWFDIENSNMVIEANTISRIALPAAPQRACGIFIEISPGPARIEGNTIRDCSAAGIRIAESRVVRVSGNRIERCRHGVMLRNIVGRAYTSGEVVIGTSPDDPTARGNLFVHWTDAAVVTDGTPGYWKGVSPESVDVRMEGNGFEPGASLRRVVWGGKLHEDLPRVVATGVIL